jgi:FAD synthase
MQDDITMTQVLEMLAEWDGKTVAANASPRYSAMEGVTVIGELRKVRPEDLDPDAAILAPNTYRLIHQGEYIGWFTLPEEGHAEVNSGGINLYTGDTVFRIKPR